jgi:predicted dehydrogenase
MMGKIHAAAWASQEGAELAVVVDARRELAEAVAGPYGAGANVELEPVLGEVDVLSICTPPHAHRAQVEAACRAGVHVLLEKPAALDLRDFDAMRAAVADAGIRLMVGMTHRFYPESRAAAGSLAGGTAGEIISMNEVLQLDATSLPDWYFDRAAAGGGILLTNGIHALDRFLWLSGAENARLERATLRNLGGRGDVEDFAELELSLDTGVSAHVQLLWQAGASGDARLDIVCERATLRIEAWQGFTVFGPEAVEERFYRDDMDFSERTLRGIRGETAALSAAVRGTEPLTSTLEENRRAFALIDQAYKWAGEVGM